MPIVFLEGKKAVSLPDRNWIKLDLHIHTLDDPKDAIDYSAHELLERAKSLGFRVLASANIRLNLRPIQRWPRT